MGRWYIPAQSTEISDWNRAAIGRATGAGAVQRSEPSRVKQTINGIDLLPLTDAGSGAGAYQTASRSITHDGSTATAEYVLSRVSVADRKAAMVAAIKLAALGPDGIVAKGFVYSVPGGDGPHRYQIEAADQNNMTSIGGLIALGVTDAHGGFWRDVNNVHVTMTQAQCVAFFAAAAAYKAAVVRRMWALIVAVTDAVDHDALDLIDIEAGTVTTMVEGEPVVSDGWPTNGS